MNTFHIVSRFVATALILTFSMASAWSEVNEKPFVVPELTTWTGAEGHTALSGRIIVKSKRLRAAAEALAADYEVLLGQRLTIVRGAAKAGDVVLSASSDKQLGQEGYRLSIGRQVEIAAATGQGAYWATRSLLQLSETSPDRSLPCGSTTDRPQYALRGFMIDYGRKFIPMDYLRHLVRIMGYYKMNTLQVHLNDNGFRQFFGNDWNQTQAAFRLECATYPGLTAKDGSYSKQEFIEFQHFAAANGIEVIPEIDAPAHALAFTQYQPEIGSEEYGMDHLDLFKPETYNFMDALWKEYIGGQSPVFIGPRVHIGTDEYSNAKQDVVEKFRAFTDHYIRYVEQFGKKAMLWGALTHAQGTTPVKADGVTMGCWYNGYADPVEMKKQGFQLVSIPDGLVYIVPAAGYYYDYLNCEYLYEHWTPAVIGKQTFEECDPAILGGMFAVWNDHAGNGISVKDIHHRTFPALQTIATKCWTATKTSLPYSEFDQRRTQLSEAPGVNELGRLSQPGTVALEMAEVRAGDSLPAEEIGYNYAVSFTLEAQEETPGTELFRSSQAVVYLSDPETGRLGFERDGYLNTFNYKLEPGTSHTLRIEGNNRSTRLYVDGKLKDDLQPQMLYVMSETDRADKAVGQNSAYKTRVYAPKAKLCYQRTLVFPLRKAGKFNSTIKNLKVETLE